VSMPPCAVAPVEAVRPLAWTAASIQASEAWVFAAPTEAEGDVRALEAWAAREADPCAALQQGSVRTPALDTLAGAMVRELDLGSGLAWIRGFSGLSELTLRLVYLKLGLALGPTVDTYGRLYDVKDTGVSYKDKPIPVSQTKESTGMHTDSSGKQVRPGVIGLACVRQAPKGGGSRVVSAAQAHEVLRAKHPRLLERLYGTFVRDVVTPGSDRDLDRVRANRFPVFSYEGRIAMRYMRYWIEKGHARLGEALAQEDLEAFDALDAALEDPAHVLAFRMAPGDLLFIDNTTTAHDRDAYEDDPASPRLMLRLWLDHRAPASKPLT
jgi:hypothetical protein